MQRLAHADFFFFAQRKHQRRNALGVFHLLLQLFVDQVGARLFDQGQVHRLVGFMARYAIEVAVQPFGEERCNRCHQFGQSDQTLVQSLVSRDFIVGVLPFPETATAEAHVPVAQVFIHKLHDLARGVGRFVVGVIRINLIHQRMQGRKDPAIDFRAFPHRDIRFHVAEIIDVGVQGEERICIVNGTKELALRFFDASEVEA